MHIGRRKVMTAHLRHYPTKRRRDRVEDMEVPSSPGRKEKASPKLLPPLLVLCLCAVVFFYNAILPIAHEYKNSGVDVEINDLKPASNINISASVVEKDHKPSDTNPIQVEDPIIEKKKLLRMRNSKSEDQEKTKSYQSADECQLGLEKYLYPKIYDWVIQKVPIAVNVKIVENQYHVIFNTGYIDPDTWYNAEYRCNDHNETAIVMSATKPGKGNVVVQCPIEIKYNETMLDTVSVVPKDGNVTIYEMQRFVECEKLDIQDYSPNNASIGLCTSIAGTGRIREIAHEWAVYHRLLGVDHTWIYINSDWDDGKHPKKSYISWIPYNLNIKAYEFEKRPWTQRSEFFRVTSQVECVLRARRMGMDWIIFTDVDEYVQINNVENNTEGVPDLKYLLDTYYKNEKDDIGGLVMNSIPFGNNLIVEKDPKKQLFIDHVYRHKNDPQDQTWTRWKQIVNPQNVHSYAIHWLGGGSNLKEIRLNPNNVRINHYKETNKGVGVFQAKNETELVLDSALAERFHDKLLAAIAEE